MNDSHNSKFHNWEPHNWKEKQELLASYVLGDLTPEEVAQVNKLLAANPELVEEVKHLQETLALLPFALPEDEPPQKLGLQIMQAATKVSNNQLQLDTNKNSVDKDSTENSIEKNIISKKFNHKQKVWLGLTGAIAASVLLGLGFYNYSLQEEMLTTRNKLSYYQETVALLRQPNNRLLPLKGINDKSEATGSFVIIPNSGKGVLSLQNLRPLPKNKVYRLWAVSNGEKVDCGDFQVNSRGQVLVQLPVDNSMVDISSALVTIEPLQSVSYPTGQMVMKGNM
ncbi:anti-sigma factor [Mastigocoleus testarum]|uniref:Regulator of SigK n=1 Tax=Mastigocoleus testarum BC008 TaxID=371196 RepID=A0A0V7ZZT9_9CYAN|nr:anti-sigma factor [Mastigocoleus testarum]KST67534.1 hypothetical protein BC008_30515 [Mastigocoleus testarum BC008]KST69830.1 hypothetical protein BC008_36335 [Mastigocoleus testarum BC008]